MADNPTIDNGANADYVVRAIDLGSGVLAQAVLIYEGVDTPVATTGGTVRYTVDNSPAVALDPPNAAARSARIRVYETSQDSTKRLYYRTDGTSPTSDGANATGFLLHGEMIVAKLATFTNFILIAEGGAFEVYVEWLTIASS